MSFDIAVGVSQQQLNNCSQQLFTSIPGLFQGSGTDPHYPGITMSWVSVQSPTFNLSPSSASVQALKNQLLKNASPEHKELVNHPSVAGAAQLPAFDVLFSDLQITLEQPGGEKTQVDLVVTLSCMLSVSGSNLQLSASSASCQPLQDPMQNFFVQNIIMPQVLASTNTALTGLSIPPPNMPGIQLSPLTATIQNGFIIAVANIVGNGSPALPASFQWPSSNFFALLSQNALQAVTNNILGTTKNYSGKGSAGSSVGGADYSYSINLVNPTVSIRGNNIIMDFGINGNVSAKITVLWVPIGINYDVVGGPSPEATAIMQPAGGNNMNIVATGLNAFTFLLEPSGNIAEKILSAITWPITQAITAVVTPIVTTSLHNINFSSYVLPSYQVNISGKQLQFTPQVASVANCSGYMGISGALQVG